MATKSRAIVGKISAQNDMAFESFVTSLVHNLNFIYHENEKFFGTSKNLSLVNPSILHKRPLIFKSFSFEKFSINFV